MPGVAKKRRVGEGAKESKDDCTSWDVKASAASTRFTNPIRALVDTMKYCSPTNHHLLCQL